MAVKLPRIFRTTPFRLTLLFLALFASAASAFLAYIYVATAGEATRRTDQEIRREMRSLVDIYDRAGMDAVNQSLIERAASEKPFLYLLLTRDGRRISGSIEESPVEDFAGGPAWATFQVTDVDAQGRDIKHPARGLQQRLRGGEVLFVGADAGDAIAHDLRSPLTRLRARLETAYIDVEAGKGDATEALAQALEDTDGVLKTFGAVLSIARLQAAGAAPDPVVFDPADLGADIAELYEAFCEEKDIEFSAELAKDLTIRGNREFLAQALANLLDNAVKYTPAGGAIMLRCRRRSSGEVEYSVTDTGPGVPEEDRERVIQRFVRLEKDRSQPGAGLGLSLVAAIAEAHGGRLELSEGPGKVGEMGPGLRVAFILPRV